MSTNDEEQKIYTENCMHTSQHNLYHTHALGAIGISGDNITETMYVDNLACGVILVRTNPPAIHAVTVKRIEHLGITACLSI